MRILFPPRAVLLFRALPSGLSRAVTGLALSAGLAATSLMPTACLYDAGPEHPLRGHFGNRLDGLPPLSLLDSSEVALRLMKEPSGDSYSYRMGFSSPLSDGKAEWSVTVRAGVPVRLEYESVSREGTVFRKTETAADWAAPGEARDMRLPEPYPLDSLYAQCRAILENCERPGIQGFGKPVPYFHYDGDYILSDCGCNDPAIMDGHPSVGLNRLRWAGN